jgi:hypothetical protein
MSKEFAFAFKETIFSYKEQNIYLCGLLSNRIFFTSKTSLK